MHAILSLCTPNFQVLANATWPNKVDYAVRNNYSFLCKNGNFTRQFSSGEKIPFIREYLHHNPQTEWVWWLDIDTLITNYHIRIEDRIDDNYHFIISRDDNGINAGSFFVRNSPEGIAYLDWMLSVYPEYEKSDGFFAEQAIMEASMHESLHFKDIIKIVPQRSINSYHHYLNSWTTLTPHSIWQRGDFVVHFPGTTLEERLHKLVPEYYYSNNIILPDNTFSFIQRLPLLEKIRERTNGQVQSGPFRGMTILPSYEWGDGDTAGKLLGLYENELFPAIEEVIEQKPDVIVNFGCAEGFYGVGMGLRTDSLVVFVDINPKGLDISIDNAFINGLTNFETCIDSSTEVLSQLLQKGQRPFLFMDCEGSEEELLDPVMVPELAGTTIIVESHDCMRGVGLIDRLRRRFEPTHIITTISQGTKNPYLPIIEDFNDEQKMLVTCEFRPSTMYWLYMVPKM